MLMGGKVHHPGGLREALLERAYAIVGARGTEAVNMRALARELGVSSAAPFRHYVDRDHLIAEVGSKAEGELEERLEAAASASAEDALTQFRAVTVAYVRFAAEHPVLFRLVHSRTTVEPMDPLAGIHRERRAKMIALIIDGQNAGLVPEADPKLIALTIEALTYGLAHMVADEHPRVSHLDSEGARALALAATQLLQSAIGLS